MISCAPRWQRAARYLPAGENVLRAFQQPFHEVRVLIVGQDPYPTPGHPVGLSFSVAPDVRPLPKSLVNIFREYADDLGFPPPDQRRPVPVDRTRCTAAEQGADGRAGQAELAPGQGLGGDHRAGDPALAGRGEPMVAILWGRNARNLRPLLGDLPAIESAHPSPMSAVGRLLRLPPVQPHEHVAQKQGADPIDWKLP